MAQASPFTNLQISNSFPISVPMNGAIVITGNVTAPATPGTYPLNIRIQSQTATQDCDGQVKACNNNSLQIINVVVTPPPILCSLSFPAGDSAFLPGESAAVRASCTQGGSPANCPALSWSQNAVGGSLSPGSTSAGANPQTTLSINSSAPYPQAGRTVNATNGTVVCTPLPFSVASPGISIDCGFLNHNETFFPGETAIFRASCTVAGVPNSICPPLNWTTSITQASMAPPQTAQGASPRSSNFTTTSSTPAPQAGSVAVKCANPAQCSANCSAPANMAPYPDHLACRLMDHHSSIFAPNDSSRVQGICTYLDAGNNITTQCPPLHWSTNITGGSLNPENTVQMANPITNFTTTNAPVNQSGYIDAHSTLLGFPPLACDPSISASVMDVGVDYVVSKITLSKPIFQLGESFSLGVFAKNIGNRNATNYTYTELSGDCGTSPYHLRPLDAGEELASGVFPCTCSTPGLNRIVARANINLDQGETDYQNNNLTSFFYCGMPFAPLCPDYV